MAVPGRVGEFCHATLAEKSRFAHPKEDSIKKVVDARFSLELLVHQPCLNPAVQFGFNEKLKPSSWTWSKALSWAGES